MIPALVYVLGALTCAACAALLLRGWGRSSSRLLLWSGLCFAGLCINNALLYLDTRLPDRDLRLLSDGASLIGVALLLYGLIWDVRE